MKKRMQHEGRSMGAPPTSWALRHGRDAHATDRVSSQTRSSFIPLQSSLSPAFTLLELILVLVIITLALGEVAPELHGFMIGSKLKYAATNLVATTQWARTKSISDGCIYRLMVDATGYQVYYQDQQSFLPTESTTGQRVNFPSDISMTLARQDGATGDHIDFFPDGTTEAGVFTLTQKNAGQMQVICQSPTERYHIESGGEK